MNSWVTSKLKRPKGSIVWHFEEEWWEELTESRQYYNINLKKWVIII